MAAKTKNKDVTGKKQIVSVLDEHSDFDNPSIQKIMKRANNCPASYWKCKSCSIPQLHKCIDNVRMYYQMEAFKKYKDTPSYREAIAKNGVSL